MTIKRANANKNSSEVSGFFIQAVIDSVAGSRCNSVKKLRDGTLLVHTKNLIQAKRLVKLIQMDHQVQVEVSEHQKLNQSKGVVRCLYFIHLSDEYILKELKSQNVTEIYRIKRTIRNEADHMGLTQDTGTYFLTFSTAELPDTLYVGYERTDVRPYIPNPLRCWKCLRFNHVSIRSDATEVCAHENTPIQPPNAMLKTHPRRKKFIVKNLTQNSRTPENK